MTGILIATAAYEAAIPFVADWIGGVIEARGAREDVAAYVAIDGPSSMRTIFAPLAARMPVGFVEARAGSSIAGVRRVMLEGIALRPEAAVVFSDIDDMLVEGALERHAEALAVAEIGFGDLEIVDKHGRPTGRRFFDAPAVPESVANGDLLDRNMIGFANASLRRSILTGPALAVPEGSLAVDWWLFSTLLASGATARRVEGIVARYRQHGANLLGASGARGLDAARRRCAMALAHYRHLPTGPGVGPRIDSLERLCADASLLARVFSAAPRAPHLWHEDVAAWIAAARRIAEKVA